MKYLYLYLLLINLTAFAMMGVDKRRARLGRWRIPERTLFLAALLGGAAGGILGMRLFRHKTLHKRFAIGFPVIFAVQLVLLVICLSQPV